MDDGEHIVNECSTFSATGEPLDVEADLQEILDAIRKRWRMSPGGPRREMTPVGMGSELSIRGASARRSR
jgi:hypothetical protein